MARRDRQPVLLIKKMPRRCSGRECASDGYKIEKGYIMHSRTKLSCAIAAVLGGGALGHVAAATSADATSSDQIQEITWTAQRRTENVQNVPIAIQAFTGESLAQLNVTN